MHGQVSRTDFRQRLLECLGGPWPEPSDLQPIVHSTLQKDGYKLEKVSYVAEPGERIPAYVLVPDGVTARSPACAIAVWHQHNCQWHIGKSEPAGLAGDPTHHTGVALVREGYVVICPDAAAFEERTCTELPGELFERYLFKKYLVQGKCLAWKNILDMKRTIDYLQTRPDVRGDRIGCYGHSLGATFTWLVAPWENRLRCMVANCCMPTYKGILAKRLVHSFSNYIPGLATFGDVENIVALIAPRPLHMNFGRLDPLSPIEFVEPALETIRRAYRDQNAAENFSCYIQDDASHTLTPAMWEYTRSWFKKHLCG